MGDFVEQTALERRGDHQYRANLSEDWRLWGPGRSRADLAEGGLIAAEGAVHDPAGRLLASGHTQLFCSPRPERFR